ncbi:MAG: tRNA preQ1(34) S-adenosylmethionine ribosyltransferase-isomerase QueA [Candidatus Kerfeldbacteria bacterium]|nr:tRNA preQ1(34) S-adenosylmethionine ribosyltransferase-isomerase QueA [Candidatus Kerfeldbacteria bacterium]
MVIQKTWQLNDFDYHLPPSLIAQHPIVPRDQARLLIAHRHQHQLRHAKFFECSQYLQAGDVLVINTSKVIPARLHGNKTTGGKIELLLLKHTAPLDWECLIGGTRPKPGVSIRLSQGYTASIIAPASTTSWQVRFNKPNITKIGTVPLPPYITSQATLADYQTVYAQQPGSAAAPTAGLHFTTNLLERLRHNGVIIAEVMLHVGLGTFTPLRADTIKQNQLHAEYAVLPKTTAQAIAQAKATGHTVTAVGTTSLRTLEAFHGHSHSGWITTFIKPGYTFTVVDHLMTNFHLPKTSLLLLVAAFMGKQFMDQAYQLAIAERYRFYSFGDAMLII